MGKTQELRYYTLDAILRVKAHYNVIIGERSNGKTFAAIRYAVEQYFKTGKEFAIIRRWHEDIRGRRASVIFSGLNASGYIETLTQDYDSISYYAGKFYPARYNGELGKFVRASKPCGYAFSLSEMEHDKSTSYPDVTTIIFDEFICHGAYLIDEFVLFTNTLSTIIRQRNDVKVFMLGNTINKFCPYFKEMGLKRVETQTQGTIDTYKYGKLKIAVERCSPLNESKPSDVYFAFDNPKLKMITGGEWELNVYPHLPCKYKPKDILFIYFIEFSGHVLQAEIVQTQDNNTFTFIHNKTTPIKKETDILVTPECDESPYHFHSLHTAQNKIHAKIISFFKFKKVFYQDNEVGEIVRNFLINTK